MINELVNFNEKIREFYAVDKEPMYQSNLKSYIDKDMESLLIYELC